MKKVNNKAERLKDSAINFVDYHAEALKDPEFRKEWEVIRPEFELRSALMDARLKKQETQADIAKKAGTTQSAIARFESGRTRPTLAFMQRLAEALEKNLEVKLT